MSEVLLYRLKMNRKAILEDLEPDQVLDYLYQEDVLDSDKYDEVRDKGTRKKQAESLLSIVERDSTAIEKMINALENSQRHLAAILKKELPDEVSLSEGILKLLQNDPDGPYPMTNVPSGYAVIINNYEFEKGTRLEFRYGSDVDVRKMRELFQWLQFNVDVYENNTADQIISIVRKYCVDKEHKKFDCFVLVLMSHGYADGVFGTDGKLVNVRRDIRKFLIGDKCISLMGKPKLIFVQACRGREANKGFVVTESGHPLVGNAPSQQVSNYPTTYTPSNLDMTPGYSPDIPPVIPQIVEYIPEDSDILISYASTAYHAALRNTYTGGWFITKLYDVISEFAKTEDLQSMITRVTREVASQKKVTKDKEVYMQCPEQIGNLRKKVFFNPKKS